MLVTEDNAAGCLERVDRSDSLQLDCETTGVGVFTGDKVCGVAVNGMYFPFRHEPGGNLPKSRLTQLVAAMQDKPAEGFHLRFDLEMLHHEGLRLPPKITDALIAALLMNENEPSFALKRSKSGVPGLAPRYLGAETVKADDALHDLLASRGLTKGDIWKLHPSEVAEYACDDLNLPHRLLTEVYGPALDRWSQQEIFAEMNDYQRLLIEMEIGGLPTDRTVIDRALHDGETARQELMREIHKAAGYALKPNSPKQVCAWLGTPNAQEETLLRCGNPIARPLLDFKAYVKRDSTYLRRFIDYADQAGVLHCQLNLTRDETDLGGTRSGRLSVSRPNLQAMPKPKTNAVYAPCRQAIIAPPGFTLVEADYKQMEVALAGHYSGDPAIHAAFREGRDLYVELIADIRRLVPNFDRQDAKILFLAIQYGAGVWKIAKMLGITEVEANECREAWRQRFPKIKRIMWELADVAEEQRCIRLWTGRWGHFDGSSKSLTCKSPYYTAWNRLIQGAGAEMVRIAMLRLWEPIRALGGRMLLQVHDSILFLIPTERLVEAKRIITREMENFPLWDIPARVDLKSGPNWLEVA